LPPPRFFLDQNVAKQVGEFLEGEGFEVTYLPKVMAEDTKDPVVAAYCEEEGYILVTHDTDFKSMRGRLLIGPRFRRIHCVLLTCTQPKARERMELALPLIVFTWARIEAGEHRPLKMHVQTTSIRIIDE
jgi:predicted nuclease of predicted toxin-antitoxin system